MMLGVLFLSAVPIRARNLMKPEVIFRSNPSGHTYRIPAICALSRGGCLAFCERRLSVSDQSSNEIVERAWQPHHGWGRIELVAADGKNSLNNPCVMSDSNHQLWLMYQEYPAGFNERTVLADGPPSKTCRTYVQTSFDNGKTWSVRRDISGFVRRAGIRSYASGPGNGIEVKIGPGHNRLVFPFNEGANGHYDNFTVYSDDEGNTWHRSAPIPQASGTGGNESTVAETTLGRLIMNNRNQAPGRYRLQAYSHDDGSSWFPAAFQRDLPDPMCEGSMLSLGQPSSTLVFLNASDASARKNGNLFASNDGGTSWQSILNLTKGSFEYSDMCVLSQEVLGIVYERQVRGTGYEICFQRIALSR